MKRISLFKALLAALLLVPPIAAHAYDVVNSGVYFNHLKKDGSWYQYPADNLYSMEVTYKTTSYNSYSGSVEVPQKDYSYARGHYFYPLGIGEDAFRESTGLTKVTFVDEPRIAYVRDRAFYGCTALTSVSLSRSQLMLIGDSAFYNCSSLTDDGIAFPSTLDSIGDYAFYGCSSLTKVDLSNTTISSIGDYVFYGCSNLKEIILPSTITSIGEYAFYGCSSLTTITIPTSVTSIGADAFYGCSSLTGITIPTSVTSIDEYAFQDCTSLTEIEIPKDITFLGRYAFGGCTSLASIDYKAVNCTSAGKVVTSTSTAWYGVFAGCTSPITVTIDENVTYITSHLFQGVTTIQTVYFNATSCTSDGGLFWYSGSTLTNAYIGNNVTTIPYGLFENCYALPSIDIPSNVTTIGGYAFYDCNALTSIVIPSNVTAIGEYVFDGCSRLATVTGLADSKITSIPDYAFYGCSALPSIDIPSSVSSIGNRAFMYCSSLTALNGLEDLSITTIPEYFITGCSSLETLTLPTTITSIGGHAFQNCTKLTTINNFSNNSNITSIPTYLFYNDTSLSSITIPSSVTSIGTYAFNSCSSLATITVQSSTAATCGTDAFSNISSSSWLVVPEDAAANYGGTAGATVATQTGWSSIAHMREVSATVPMTTDEGYATYYSPYSYTLDENLEGGIISGADADGNLTIEWKYGSGEGESPVVPAGTAILVKGPQNAKSEDSEDHLIVNTTINTDDTTYPQPETNLLFGTVDTNYGYTDVPTDEGNSDNYYYYKLTHYTDPDTEKTSLGFYWGTEGGGAFSVSGGGAKKAWLALPKDLIDGTSDGAKISFYPLEGDGTSEEVESSVESGIGNDIENGADSDETATGISSLSADSGAAIIYNLAGQRVNDMNKRGVYIVNGRKVVKK